MLPDFQAPFFEDVGRLEMEGPQKQIGGLQFGSPGDSIRSLLIFSFTFVLVLHTYLLLTPLP